MGFQQWNLNELTWASIFWIWSFNSIVIYNGSNVQQYYGTSLYFFTGISYLKMRISVAFDMVSKHISILDKHIKGLQCFFFLFFFYIPCILATLSPPEFRKSCHHHQHFGWFSRKFENVFLFVGKTCQKPGQWEGNVVRSDIYSLFNKQ